MQDAAICLTVLYYTLHLQTDIQNELEVEEYEQFFSREAEDHRFA